MDVTELNTTASCSLTFSELLSHSKNNGDLLTNANTALFDVFDCRRQWSLIFKRSLFEFYMSNVGDIVKLGQLRINICGT